MVHAGNKTKHLSSVSHTTKKIHYHHRDHPIAKENCEMIGDASFYNP